MRVALATYAGPTPFFDLLIPDRGLAILASILERRGADYRIFDLNRLDYSCGQFLSDLRQFNPDVVGFKFFDTGFAAVELLAAQIRREFPRALVIAGGPHVTLFQEHILHTTSVFDVLVYGEGERAFPLLLDAHARNGRFESVPGVIYRREDGTIHRTAQDLVHDLDALPFPKWDALPLEDYLPIAMLNVTRGCPFTCSFCAHNHTWGYREKPGGYEPVVRKRSVPSVLQEVEHAQRCGLSLFGFTDSIPLPNLWRSLAQGFIGLKQPVFWTSFAYVGHFTEKDLTLLAQSGCAALWYGVESGNESLRRAMGKNFSNADVLQTFHWCRTAGIAAIPGFIIGFPGETLESLSDTMKLRDALEVPVSVLSPFILDPGSPVCFAPEKFAIELREDWQCLIIRRMGLNEFEIPYYTVHGRSNVELWNHWSAHCDYPGYTRDRNVAESEFAYLIAKATGRDATAVVRDLDTSLKTFNKEALRTLLTDIRQQSVQVRT